MFRIVVARAMELKRDVSVDADGEVIVHHVHRLEKEFDLNEDLLKMN